MPSIGPETYEFLVYATYPKSQSSRPTLVVYLEVANPSIGTGGINATQLQTHAQNEDIESKIAVTRVVSETVNHLFKEDFSFKVLKDSLEFNAALSNLESTYGEDLYRFLKHCWKLAQACQYQTFPQRYPA